VKILIIEDETGLRESIEAYFTGGDSICETASDFTSALAKVSVYRYDCIILDLTLPQGNGLDIIRHLKNNQHNDGVLIVSAKNSLDDRLMGLDLGADDYLTKPFPPIGTKIARYGHCAAQILQRQQPA
jgi:DNA-binding response OmpR family regulator